MRELRIGLVGAGLIGEAHSAVLQRLAAARPGRVELAAVADPRRERRQHIATTYGYERVFDDAHTLLEEARVDALFVCSPTAFHAEAVQAAAAIGVHVFCEKPLAMSYREARQMADEVRRGGVRSQTGLVLRYSAVYTVMRDLLQSAEVGSPVAVVLRDDQCFPIRGIHSSTWRTDRKLTAGGTLIEHGVHDLDLLTWIFGPVARLRAWSQNRSRHPGIEDYMAVELEFASGLRAQLVNVWHDMVQRFSNRRLEIFCERGFFASDHDMLGEITYQIGDRELRTMATDEVTERFEKLLRRADHSFRQWYGIPYVLQDVQFIEALLNDDEPTPNLEAGVEAQRLAEAVYVAAESGTEVDATDFPPRSRRG